MNITAPVSIGLMLIALSGCTPIPAQYSQPASYPVNNSGEMNSSDSALLALVGDTRIGMTQTIADPVSGLTSTVSVTSEYFSANGRSCRRFSQHYSNAAMPVNKLACKAGSRWQEIPLASIIE